MLIKLPNKSAINLEKNKSSKMNVESSSKTFLEMEHVKLNVHLSIRN